MITVLGAGGFIGSNLVREMQGCNIPFYAPHRDEFPDGRELGDVIYCIGLTAEFRSRPFDTIEAHVSKLSAVLSKCSFNSFTYLSSTRIYLKNNDASSIVDEESNIILNSNDPTDIFGSSKVTGEILTLNCGKPNVKVARVSNVFGNDFKSKNFITSIVKDAVDNGKIHLHTTPDSSKDYIFIQDLCKMLISLARLNKAGIYNLSFGKNIENIAILNRINELTGAEITYSDNPERIIFKEISNKKTIKETRITPSVSLLDTLEEIISNYKLCK